VVKCGISDKDHLNCVVSLQLLPEELSSVFVKYLVFTIERTELNNVLLSVEALVSPSTVS
jgi:hypothetical protein